MSEKGKIGLLITCCAIILPIIHGNVLNDEENQTVAEHKLACIAELNMDSDKLDAMRLSGEIIFDNDLNCYSGCFMRKTEILEEDNTINEQVFREKAPVLYDLEKWDEVVNTCKILVGNDICETGGKVVSCLMDYNIFSIV